MGLADDRAAKVRTRLAGLGPLPRLLLGAALLLLIACGVAGGPGPGGRHARTADQGDAVLYRAIDRRMLDGQGYYPAAAAEQRRRGYPLRPFVTMRPPTLAVMTTLLGGPEAMMRVLMLLALAATATLTLRLHAERLALPPLIAATVLLVLQAVAQLQPRLAFWHELWAGLLVAVALACRAPGRWRLALLLGLLSAMVRELALPLLPVMALAALLERRRGEALAWSGATLVALLLLVLHAAGVAAVVQAGDAASPGWGVHGGWQFDLAVARDCTLLTLLPWWAAAVLVPLALLGWAAWPGGFALRVAMLLGLWLGVFLLIGRPDNAYWGLLMSPLLTAGIALAPAALRDLIAGEVRRERPEMRSRTAIPLGGVG